MMLPAQVHHLHISWHQPCKEDSAISDRIEQALGIKINPSVFFISAVLIGAFILFGSVFTETAKTVFESIQATITHRLGWVYNVTVTSALCFCGWLALSKHGKTRLGPDDARPDYNRFTWFAMLFSAGMGIGVLFWSVAEPLTHFQSPPRGVGGTVAAAQPAVTITLWHWGLHGWAVYVIVGLALAYYSFRRGMPLTLRSMMQPILGRFTAGPAGHAVDIFAVLGTMFGVATTLGLGAKQVNAGLAHLMGIEISIGTQLLLIAGFTAAASASVVSGLDRGIRILSVTTIYLALALFAYVLFTGPTLAALSAIAQNTGHYVSTLATSLLWTDFGGSKRWQGNWSLFYWGWWIAWSPFVGMFIARISRGRTIREFVLGVLLVPTALSCVWFSTFGGIAIHRALAGDVALTQAVSADVSVAIFVFFDAFPFPAFLSVVGSAVIVFFFVTSSDSASLVIDYLTSRGLDDTPKRQRLFWAIGEGVVAASLLLSGGLKPMRTFQLTTGLPLSVILLLTSIALTRSLGQDSKRSSEA